MVARLLVRWVLTVQVTECCKQWSCIGALLLVCWLGVQVTELFVGRPPLHVICRATTTPWTSDWKCFQVHSSASCIRLLQTRPANENWDAVQGEPKYLVTEEVVGDKMSFTVSSSVQASSVRQQVLTPSGVDQWVLALFKCFKCLPHRQQVLQWNSSGALLNTLQNSLCCMDAKKDLSKFRLQSRKVYVHDMN